MKMKNKQYYLDRLENGDYQDQIIDALEKAYRSQQQGWHQDLFFHPEKETIGVGSLCSAGTWQPEDNMRGKQIDASFYSVDYVEPQTSAFEEGETTLKDYIGEIEGIEKVIEKFQKSDNENEYDFVCNEHDDLRWQIIDHEWDEYEIPELAREPEQITRIEKGLKDYIDRYFGEEEDE